MLTFLSVHPPSAPLATVGTSRQVEVLEIGLKGGPGQGLNPEPSLPILTGASSSQTFAENLAF
jgi:hypothetical protein